MEDANDPEAEARNISGNKRHTLLECETASKPQKHQVVQSAERPFTCDQCGKSFTSQWVLTGHRKLHSGQVHTCDDCGKTFTTAVSLNLHRRIHTGENLVSCDQCGKIFTRNSELKRHQVSHSTERPFPCSHCRMSFKTVYEQRSHEIIHSGVQHKCEQCGKSFRHKSGLREHQRRHTGERLLSCDQCEKKFLRLSQLIGHRRVHSGERPFSCDQCGKSFTTLVNLTGHKRIHTAEYVCEQCGKSFIHNCLLKTHMLVHTGEKPFRCDECGKGFMNLYALRDHRLVHKGDKCHRCDVCGKGFVTRSKLKVHKDTHVLTFPCDECGKGLSSKSKLKLHQLMHNGNYRIRCKTCGRGFQTPGKLRSHELCHAARPHRCRQCGKTFKKAHFLKRHHKVSHEAARHACEHCGKSFMNSRSLKAHQTRHTGKTVFSCDRCGESFITARSLQSHQSAHGCPRQFKTHVNIHSLCAQEAGDKIPLGVNVDTHLASDRSGNSVFKVKQGRLASQKAHMSALHCCVPLCSNSSRYNARASFHLFPKDAIIRALWFSNIRRDNFCITRSTRLCSRHFNSEDFVVTLGGRRKLQRGAIPVLFAWNNYAEPSARRSLWDGSADGTVDSESTMETVASDHNYCVPPETRPMENDAVPEKEALRQKMDQLEVEALQLQDRFGLQRFAGSDESIHFYTRFASYKHLQAFWKLLAPAVEARMARLTGTRSVAAGSEFSRPSTRLPLIDELLLFLMHLSVGFPHGDLAERFGVERSAVGRILTTWTDFLSELLGNIPVWLPPDMARAHLPPEFSAFPDTHVVLHCTEICFHTPSALVASPSDKSHTTLKAMMGTAPHGAVTFVSGLFAGSVSDCDVFKLSGITNLLKPESAIMVGEGFLVDNLAPYKVYQLALLSGNTKMTQAVARLRAHVERPIRRLKEYKLFNKVKPLSECGNVEELFSVACLLLNFQNGALVEAPAPGL